MSLQISLGLAACVLLFVLVTGGCLKMKTDLLDASAIITKDDEDVKLHCRSCARCIGTCS